MEYFKHYSNASSSRTINHLFDEFGHAGYAYWFLLLELCNENWDGHSEPKFTFHTRIVRQKLRISYRKLELFLGKTSEKGALLFELSKSELSLEIPKLLEVKTSRSVIKSNKKQLTVYKNRIEENRRESIPPDFFTQSVEYLNDACNRSFDHRTKATRNALRKIFKCGYGIDDIRSVIDFKKSEWGTCEKMEGNLKPSVLFRFSNFEKYADEAKEKKARVKKLLEE